jgi:hypothetical protein
MTSEDAKLLLIDRKVENSASMAFTLWILLIRRSDEKFVRTSGKLRSKQIEPWEVQLTTPASKEILFLPGSVR